LQSIRTDDSLANAPNIISICSKKVGRLMLVITEASGKPLVLARS